MLSKQKIMAFVATVDAARARAFYETVLGLKLKKLDDYGLMFDAHGNYLRISIVREFKPAPYSVLSWELTDIYGTIAGLTSRAVVFEHFEGMGQDKAGVWTAPDGTKVAWFKDPDGNMLSLTQF